MQVILTNSRWKEVQLDDKTVEFRQPCDTVPRLGRFLAVDCPNGFLSLSILTDETGLDQKTVRTRYYIPQAGVDRVEVHPNESIAHFRLLM
jgi:hypothetical protein